MSKLRYFFGVKLEKNWKRVNEKLYSQKVSADDFRDLHRFTHALCESLRNKVKMGVMGIEGVSEEYQKRYILDYKSKKVEELKQILDSELWTHSQVSGYFQAIIDRINSPEAFESHLNAGGAESLEVSAPRDTLSTSDNEYKVLISLMKFMTIIEDFLKLIRSFP